MSSPPNQTTARATGAPPPNGAAASGSVPPTGSPMATPSPELVAAKGAGGGSSVSPPPTTAATGPAPASASAAPAAGAKRPAVLAAAREGRQLSEKKLRRLEKNRLSARECRRRKREAAQNLEREINVLEGENLRLRLQLQIGEEAEESSRQEEERLTEGLDVLLKSGASEGEIYATIEEFKEKFADYGRDRRSAIEFHLRNVERLLMPTTTTSVAMRALHGGSQSNTVTGAGMGTVMQNGASTVGAAVSAPGPEVEPNAPPSTIVPDRIVSSKTPGTLAAKGPILPQPTNSAAELPASSTNPTANSGVTPDVASSANQMVASPPNAPLEPKKLFQYLVNYLNVSPQQAAALKDSRSVAKELDSTLAEALSMLQELRKRLTQCGEDLETEFDSVRAILTPTQAAKFLVWVSNNGACMHMLNELWSKVYPRPADAASAADGGG